MQTHDISWLNLFLGLMILAVPAIIFRYYRANLSKDSILSTARMFAQLLFAGFYLKYIFELDSLLLNIAWVVIMTAIAGFSVVKRSELDNRMYWAIIVGIIANILLNGVIISALVIGTDQFFSARYMIPIMGMVIGNTLNTTIIGIKTFFGLMDKDYARYKYLLACGATRREALLPFKAQAFRNAFSPTIAQNAAIGLIWLPGMMTGQILGGSDPMVAIKYQVLIVVSIFAGGVLTVFITLWLANFFAFNEYDMLRSDVFKEKK